MKRVATIWLIFGLLFFALSIFHFYQAFQNIEEFEIKERPFGSTGSVKILGMDIDELTKDLAKNMNKYITKINRSNKSMNIIAAVGYLLAAGTAFFSLYMIIQQN